MGDISYAGEVRKELAAHISKAKHCVKAELRGIFEGSRHEKPFCIYSEGLTIPEKCISLVKKAYSLEPVTEQDKYENKVYLPTGGSLVYQELMRDSTLERDCCRRAYLRGWFLAAGTVTDPEGHYHLEIVTGSDEKAEFLQGILEEFDLNARISHRKNNTILYIKEGQKVVDFLNIVGAHVALMEFENARIVKEVRGRINRRVNCETANIKKTISASSRQVEDIRYIEKELGLEQLSESLEQIARLRLDNPEASLTELGEMMNPPVGKSGVNHRLRRLTEMADKLRTEGASK